MSGLSFQTSAFSSLLNLGIIPTADHGYKRVYRISEGHTCKYITRNKQITHPCIDILFGQISLWSGNLKGYPWRYNTMWSFSMMREVCFTGKMRHWDTLPGCESSSWRRYLYSMVISCGSSCFGPTGPIDMSTLLVWTTLATGDATWGYSFHDEYNDDSQMSCYAPHLQTKAVDDTCMM